MSRITNFIIEKKYYLTLIFLFSFFINFYSGFKGIFPLDSFLIFNSGNNLINGYHPFKDYWSITGPLLDYIQYIFFFLFGTSWKSYVAHAAIVNSLVSILIFFFFNEIGLNKNHSLIYALSLSLLAYTSVGTPFMDHHATIFSLISLMFFILGLKKNDYYAWFFFPFLLGLSFLSKQIPSAYFTILYLIILFFYFFLNKKKFKKIITFICGGSALFLSITLSIIFINKIPISNIFTQYFLYPISIGNLRFSNINFDIQNVVFQFKFIYFSLIPIIVSIYFSLKTKKINTKLKTDILILCTTVLSAFVFIYSQILSKNQILIFFLIPFYLGISHYYLELYAKKKYFIFFVFFLLIISSIKFHLRFNVEKKFMDLANVNLDISEDAVYLDNRLSKLKWITPEYSKSPKSELILLNQAKDEIIKNKNNTIIITDYQILPWLTNLKTVSPNKWYDGLSVPNSKNRFFENYKLFFNQKLEEQKINFIYVVGKNKLKYIEKFLKSECTKKNTINNLILEIDISNCY